MDDRVEALERERSEEIARANAAVAAAQDRSYWLDRWNLDLNALMRRRGASELRTALRAARAVYRLLYDTRNRLREAAKLLPGGLARARRVVEQERARAGVLPGAQVVPALDRAGLRPHGGDAFLAIGPGSAEVGGELAAAHPELVQHRAEDAAAALARLAELHGTIAPGGRLVVAGDASAGASPAWLLASSTPDWRIALYLEGDPDVYVLERR
ncbi:MAG: hypothetical protein QOH58_2527 [Thermoleophilaceae bacterium]|jgi:hypothetical protein|nr:hypothetical protein [Thermoleophilaceae bacterium]